MSIDFELKLSRRRRRIWLMFFLMVLSIVFLFIVPRQFTIPWLILVFASVLSMVYFVTMHPLLFPILPDIDWSPKGYVMYGEYSDRFGIWYYKLLSMVILFLFLGFSMIPVTEDRYGDAIPLIVIGVLFSVIIWRFGVVEVESKDGSIKLQHGFYRDEIKVEAIARLELVEIHPFRDYGGHGRRVGYDGSIGYISWNRGVRVDTSDRKSYVISLSRPEEFKAMFRARRSSHLDGE